MCNLCNENHEDYCRFENRIEYRMDEKFYLITPYQCTVCEGEKFEDMDYEDLLEVKWCPVCGYELRLYRLMDVIMEEVVNQTTKLYNENTLDYITRIKEIYLPTVDEFILYQGNDIKEIQKVEIENNVLYITYIDNNDIQYEYMHNIEKQKSILENEN